MNTFNVGDRVVDISKYNYGAGVVTEVRKQPFYGATIKVDLDGYTAPGLYSPEQLKHEAVCNEDQTIKVGDLVRIAPGATSSLQGKVYRVDGLGGSYQPYIIDGMAFTPGELVANPTIQVGDRVHITVDFLKPLKVGDVGMVTEVPTLCFDLAADFASVDRALLKLSEVELVPSDTPLTAAVPTYKGDTGCWGDTCAELDNAYIPDLDGAMTDYDVYDADSATNDHDYHMGYAAGYRYDRAAVHVKAGCSEQYRDGFLAGMAVYQDEQYADALEKLIG